MASKKGNGETNVKATDHMGTDQFAKQRAIAKALVRLKLAVFARAFHTPLQSWVAEQLDVPVSDGSIIPAITLPGAWCLPAMGLQHMSNVGLTRELDVLLSLMNIENSTSVLTAENVI
jgi:hypothetical protein